MEETKKIYYSKRFFNDEKELEEFKEKNRLRSIEIRKKRKLEYESMKQENKKLSKRIDELTSENENLRKNTLEVIKKTNKIIKNINKLIAN